jgi:hypothetical protein
MICTCIVMHSLFCQLPNYNLFTQHVIYLYGEMPLVNCGPRSILYIYITIYCKHGLLSASIILLYRKLISLSSLYIYSFVFSKRVRLTTSLQVGAKYFGCVVCRFHVAAGTKALTSTTRQTVFWRQLATTFRSDFFLLLVD